MSYLNKPLAPMGLWGTAFKIYPRILFYAWPVLLAMFVSLFGCAFLFANVSTVLLLRGFFSLSLLIVIISAILFVGVLLYFRLVLFHVVDSIIHKKNISLKGSFLYCAKLKGEVVGAAFSVLSLFSFCFMPVAFAFTKLIGAKFVGYEMHSMVFVLFVYFAVISMWMPSILFDRLGLVHSINLIGSDWWRTLIVLIIPNILLVLLLWSLSLIEIQKSIVMPSMKNVTNVSLKNTITIIPIMLFYLYKVIVAYLQFKSIVVRDIHKKTLHGHF